MESFFGVGLPELILILLIAGIVMGPERIGRTARWLGRITAQLQAISRGFIRQLNAELDSADESGELKGALEDVKALQAELAQLRKELSGTLKEGKKVLGETKTDVERSIAPSSLISGNGAEETSDDQPTSPPTRPRRVETPDDPE